MNTQKYVVVLGKFDGVHVAHTNLITKAVELAKEKGALSLVYSMQKSDADKMTDNDQKVNILKSLSVDKVVTRELDEDFMSLTAEEFVNTVLKDELGACAVVVGENFRFGKNRSADASDLSRICRSLGIDVYISDTICLKDRVVSSTLVRELISRGNVATAAMYLGRPYSLQGTVVHGKHLGRRLGFPTINLYPPASVVTPLNGVYATRVVYDGKAYPAITNVGCNPTVEHSCNIKVETHIFDNSDNWYDREITVEFLEFIRPEVQFENEEALKTQVEKDENKAMEYHGLV